MDQWEVGISELLIPSKYYNITDGMNKFKVRYPLTSAQAAERDTQLLEEEKRRIEQRERERVASEEAEERLVQARAQQEIDEMERLLVEKHLELGRNYTEELRIASDQPVGVAPIAPDNLDTTISKVAERIEQHQQESSTPSKELNLADPIDWVTQFVFQKHLDKQAAYKQELMDYEVEEEKKQRRLQEQQQKQAKQKPLLVRPSPPPPPPLNISDILAEITD
jgi:hypothetical protein